MKSEELKNALENPSGMLDLEFGNLEGGLSVSLIAYFLSVALWKGLETGNPASEP